MNNLCLTWAGLHDGLGSLVLVMVSEVLARKKHEKLVCADLLEPERAYI